MAYRFFVIPAFHPEGAQDELNAFIRSHRVLSVDRRWIDHGDTSHWSFCVDYVESSGGTGHSSGKDGSGRERIDYREKLSAEDFAVFAKLRELRKEIAKADAIPVYMVFTNDQLAAMVEGRATTKTELEKIAGVGDARIEKYGARVLELLQQHWNSKDADATSKPPF